MKKIIAFLLTALMVLSLAACGGEPASEQVITRATEAPTEAPAETEAASTEAPETEAAPEAPEVFAFEAEGVTLVPGEAFDASALPEAESTYEVPSCAIEGMDIVYSYGAFEVTAFNDGTGETIYSIYILDPNVTTPEGIALGDSRDAVVAALGENYEEDGTSLVYQAGSTLLTLIFQEDTLASIEYRMAQ